MIRRIAIVTVLLCTVGCTAPPDHPVPCVGCVITETAP